MLDRRGGRPADARTLVAGALILIAAAGALAYLAFDWQRNGCGCDESLYPGWTWIIIAVLAGMSALTAAALLARAARRAAGR